METEKKYKWALTGFIVMAALNAVILLTLWMNYPDGSSPGMNRDWGRERNSPHKFMQKELGLSDVQVDSMARLRKAHFREMRNLRQELENHRRAYFDFIMSAEAENSQQRDSLLSELTKQYIKIELSLFTHMSEMKGVLSNEQQQAFKRLMKESLLRDRRNYGEQRQRRHR